MYCTNCGKEIENKSTFCSFCGERVQTTDWKKKNNKVYLMIFLFLLAVFFILIVIIMGKGNKEKISGNEMQKTEELNNSNKENESGYVKSDNEDTAKIKKTKMVYLCTLEWHPNDEKRIAEYDDYGNLLKKEYFAKDVTEPYYTEEYSYDKQGRQISSKVYYDDGTVEEWVKSTYDDRGNLVSEEYLDLNGKVYEIVQHEYNQKGKCLSSKYIQTEGNAIIYEVTYEYDKNYDLSKKVEYSYGALSATTIYTQEGNVFKETILDETGQLMHGKESHYNNGVIQKEFNFNSNGEMYLKKVYFYKEDGKLNLIRYHDDTDDNYEIDSYDYDENGNVISIRETYLNGLEGSTEYVTHYGYDYQEVKVYDVEDVLEISELEEGNYEADNLIGQEIDATQGSVILRGILEYRRGTNAAETMAKEIYVLHVEPVISDLKYYSYEDEILIEEDVTEIDISGLYDEEGVKGQYDGKNVLIEGEIWPTTNSHWFNSFAISMENIEFED